MEIEVINGDCLKQYIPKCRLLLTDIPYEEVNRSDNGLRNLNKEKNMNKVVLGDCLIEMKNIEDKSIDMILCDLPYGTTACKWDTIIPFEPLWEQYKRIIKDNGAIVLTASQPFTSALVMRILSGSNMSGCGIKFLAKIFIRQEKDP